MKIAHLILILNHLQQLYHAAGAKTPAEDIKVFTDALRPHANVPVNQFVSAVRDGLAKEMTVSKPPGTKGSPKTKVSNAASIDTQVKLLRASGTDRSAFENAFANLKSAKHLTLAELAEIARQYAYTVTKYKSKASALDDISKAFVRQARFENKLRQRCP